MLVCAPIKEIGLRRYFDDIIIWRYPVFGSFLYFAWQPLKTPLPPFYFRRNKNKGGDIFTFGGKTLTYLNFSLKKYKGGKEMGLAGFSVVANQSEGKLY